MFLLYDKDKLLNSKYALLFWWILMDNIKMIDATEELSAVPDYDGMCFLFVCIHSWSFVQALCAMQGSLDGWHLPNPHG